MFWINEAMQSRIVEVINKIKLPNDNNGMPLNYNIICEVSPHYYPQILNINVIFRRYFQHLPMLQFRPGI